ncbi:hypothetical protein D3C86_1533110 [compost metagenome]
MRTLDGHDRVAERGEGCALDCVRELAVGLVCSLGRSAFGVLDDEAIAVHVKTNVMDLAVGDDGGDGLGHGVLQK